MLRIFWLLNWRSQNKQQSSFNNQSNCDGQKATVKWSERGITFNCANLSSLEIMEVPVDWKLDSFRRKLESIMITMKHESWRCRQHHFQLNRPPTRSNDYLLQLATFAGLLVIKLCNLEVGASTCIISNYRLFSDILPPLFVAAKSHKLIQHNDDHRR